MAVLRGVARGVSNRDIRRRLGIQEQTVKNHVSVLIQKMHVRNRVQLAVTVGCDSLSCSAEKSFIQYLRTLPRSDAACRIGGPQKPQVLKKSSL
jgi:predicted transcriptional regulator